MVLKDPIPHNEAVLTSANWGMKLQTPPLTTCWCLPINEKLKPFFLCSLCYSETMHYLLLLANSLCRIEASPSVKISKLFNGRLWLFINYGRDILTKISQPRYLNQNRVGSSRDRDRDGYPNFLTNRDRDRVGQPDFMKFWGNLSRPLLGYSSNSTQHVLLFLVFSCC